MSISDKKLRSALGRDIIRSKQDKIERLRQRVRGLSAEDGEAIDQLRDVIKGVLDLLADEL